ncbi:hypothetical protein E0H36_18645 [Rhizobium leguminosarum bv. viciae]|uniref:hypothetical protein n=1 Tax=Rhizobium leguminosarum TaxID=384 RepID=UPI001031F91B|nr:hypothetical protein [Rhizobium leguminosarum]MBY5485177.1 hypothetical protein [Rhizobium leguminosarum]TAY88114.1 hypothetical protein ELH83_09940 [Rhizobium leguminosarum]TBZ31260.1 hypothetical protein E0H36_18645 [Rhizobium leguminosarum bv. viciae]
MNERSNSMPPKAKSSPADRIPRSTEVVEVDAYVVDLQRILMGTGTWEELTEAERIDMQDMRAEVTVVFDHYSKRVLSCEVRWKRPAYSGVPNERF